jgi:tripeptide aminopeptidase
MGEDQSIEERFLRYVKIDTHSDPASTTQPSTRNQFLFGHILVTEFREMGATAVMDQNGYVTADIPSNTDKEVPPLCFCAHLDTSPDCGSEQVMPIVHSKYDGRDIVLPADQRQVIRTRDFPELLQKTGMDIITADGTTLLGADNKAGVTELMEAVRQLMLSPGIEHGSIRILFTPDEEIGRDTLGLTRNQVGADFAYSVDGHSLGTINDQTFAVADVLIEITGATIHTGKGGGLMESAIKIGAELIGELPAAFSPEQATGGQGFIHPFRTEGKPGKAVVGFQLRAFDEKELMALAERLRKLAARVVGRYKRSAFTFDLQTRDRNLKEILKDHAFLVEIAKEAMMKAGLSPVVQPLRGSTTGASLSKMGIPCPNIFTGQHGVHGKLEWICVQDMEKAVETILNICSAWAEWNWE